MTRTSAEDYAASRIYMNAVDTGWINDENPLEVAKCGARRVQVKKKRDKET